MKQLLRLWIVGFLLVGGFSPAFGHEEVLTQSALRGKIQDNRYYDPTGTFSIPVMAPVFNRIINEFNNPAEKACGVSFQNDFGMLERVEVMINVKPLFMKYGPLANHPNCMFSFIHDSLLHSFPGTKVLEKKEIEIDEVGTACAGILFIPKGSTITDATTKIREDSIRAYVISFEGDNLVTVSVQEPPLIKNIGRKNEQDNERLIKSAIDLRKKYRNQ